MNFEEYLDRYDDLILLLQKLPISSDSEIALSKKEISLYFSGKEISNKIEEVRRNILSGNLKNTREDILRFLGV